jgi:hypothetical protein
MQKKQELRYMWLDRYFLPITLFFDSIFACIILYYIIQWNVSGMMLSGVLYMFYFLLNDHISNKRILIGK